MQSDSLTKSQLTLLGFDEGGEGDDGDDDDGWEPIKSVTGLCDSDSGYWRNNAQDSVWIAQHARQMREGGSSHHTPVRWLGAEDKDGPCRCIIGPSWVLHLPAGYSCIGQGLQQNTKFNIVILWLGKMNKTEFFFFWQCSRQNSYYSLLTLFWQNFEHIIEGSFPI